MGQSESSFKRTYEDTVSQLSMVQLGEIASKFNELYAKAGGRKGHVVDREAFSEYFHLPVAVGDRLFDAFDEQNNGKISFEEFVCGLAVLLHGSFSDKCYLIFRVFNLNEDEGISREELTTMLTAILHSTHTILYTVAETDKAVLGGEDMKETVKRMVDSAFSNCDISRTGKLLPLEFEYWLKRNPKILDTLLSFNTKKATLGPLIMSPSEQQLSTSEGKPLTVTMEPSSPTLFQLGPPDDSDVDDSWMESSGALSTAPTSDSKDTATKDEDTPTKEGVDQVDAPTKVEGNQVERLTEGEDAQIESQTEVKKAQTEGALDKEEEKKLFTLDLPTGDTATKDTPTEVVGTPSDQPRSIMHEESGLSIDTSSFPRVTSSDRLGPASPVLPTTTMESVVMEMPPVSEERSEVEKDEAETKSIGSDELATEVGQELDSGSAVQLALSTTDSIPEEVEVGEEMREEERGEGEKDFILPPSSAPASRSPFPELEEQHINVELFTSWVLNPWTQQMLLQHPAAEHLTCPALIADIKLSDQVSDLLASHFPGEMRKPLLSVEHVSMNGDGLRRLVTSGSLHAALDLTARFLSAHGQGLGQAGQLTMHTEKTLQMWGARIALLVHLRMYKEAENELEAFREMLNPDLYYEYHTHSYPGKTGSMVPFSLRLLHAQLPALTNRYQLALDRLCSLQAVCEQVLSEIQQCRLPGVQQTLSAHDQQVALSLWRNRLVRVKSVTANTFVALQDFYVAIEIYEGLAKEMPSLEVELYSGIGRLYLHVGDLHSAQKVFNKVAQLAERETTARSTIKINEALVNVFLARWQAARECFSEALTFDPNNLTIKSNVSVCTFYQGRLKEAIKEMENLLHSDPAHSLQPAVLANLAAAYELESGNSLSKKVNFIPLLAEHTGEGFQINSLNIK